MCSIKVFPNIFLNVSYFNIGSHLKKTLVNLLEYEKKIEFNFFFEGSDVKKLIIRFT